MSKNTVVKQRNSTKRQRLVFAVLWLIVTLCIGLMLTVFRHYPVIRGDVIDIFAIPFVAFFLAMIRPMPALLLSIISLLIGIVVEVSQYLKLADKLGFERESFAHQFLGNTFSWHDIGMYFLGAVLTYWLVSWIQSPTSPCDDAIEY
ncbi:MAG: DUF2809 domain-containing protein [Pelistega sp.]|nr:DUF2809 domain-containing protein [Pelistega sp.]